MVRNETLHIMVKLGFFDAANTTAEKFMPKKMVFLGYFFDWVKMSRNINLKIMAK